MNLQTTISQANIFPFRFVGSRANETLKSPENYNKQEAKLFEVETFEPKQKENLALSPRTIAVIGINGKRRFDEFKNYPDGWYGGKGKEISKRSVFIFEQFIKYLPVLKSARPSLFFTLEGNLSIGWEDKNRQSIEVEFYADRIEYFIENTDEESSTTLANIFQFTEKIKNLLK